MHDLHYAIRSLRKSPTFTLAAVATLSIGIGATIAVFALANAVLLEPLQAPGADRIVRFQTVRSGFASEITSAQRFDHWRSQSEVFEDVAALSGLAVARVRSMNDIVAESTGRTRFEMWLMTLFGGSALLLSVVGVYGLAAQSVQERNREIGIRLAIGAAPVHIRNMLFRQGMAIALIGIAVGSVAALGLGRVMAGLLFGVSPWDPLVFLAVSVLVGAVTIVAVWIPARRSIRVQPMTALRAD